MPNKKDQSERQIVGFLGVGLDNSDGHQRVTRSDHFLLVGGSSATHESMQEVVIRFDESLKKRGKRLHDTPAEEAIDLLHKATKSV